ncbi:MAG: OsmC family protein [Chloroflexi bacterium]|nr:OsmC family protein [Chloroflexota bacterium]
MVVVVVHGEDGLRQEIHARDKMVVADEPSEAGGTNAGPTPYELLLGALGACTAITIVLYARRKGWPVERVQVELEHARVHSRDCEACASKDVYLDRISKLVTVAGPLDETQRQRLEDISRRCPVQRTLAGTVQIDDRLRLGHP